MHESMEDQYIGGGGGGNMFEAPFPLLRFRMKTEWNVSVFGLVFPLKTIENGDI